MKHLGRIQKVALSVILLLVIALQPVQAVFATTSYESDGAAYEEGYIFVGESHINIACTHVYTDATQTEGGNLSGVKNVHYELDWTYDIGDQPDHPNRYIMSGNLFFVFGGLEPNDSNEEALQTSKEYIYSDGHGQHGVAVTKIHQIIENNPNIAHWNIISWHGAVQAARTTDRSIPDYYAASYRNWMEYEFPEADIYFLSISTMTKYYRPARNPELFNQVLKESFPDNYLDYTDFFNARYPQGMWDPRMRSDSLHWSSQTYIELVTDVIKEIQHRRGMDYEVAETDGVLYTNDKTVIYLMPDLDSMILFAEVAPGLPVHVTGVTDNGFFRVDLSGITVYIHGAGLSENG